MQVKYIGHACFLLTTGNGTALLTDPYESGSFDGAVKYRPIGEKADIVLVSHDHPDHSYTEALRGSPEVVDREGERVLDGIRILGVPTWHDASEGSDRGANIVFRIHADDLSICHLGDLGHTLDDRTAGRLRPVDVLMMPVGGYFTVGSREVDALIRVLEPRLVIPMHFKTEGVDFPIAPVDDFLEGRSAIRRPGSSGITLKAGEVPEGVLVLEPANLP